MHRLFMAYVRETAAAAKGRSPLSRSHVVNASVRLPDIFIPLDHELAISVRQTALSPGTESSATIYSAA